MEIGYRTPYTHTEPTMQYMHTKANFFRVYYTFVLLFARVFFKLFWIFYQLSINKYLDDKRNRLANYIKGKSWKYNLNDFVYFQRQGLHILSPFSAYKILPELYIRIYAMMLPKELPGWQFKTLSPNELGLWGTYQRCSYLKVSKQESNTVALPQDPSIIYTGWAQRMNLLLKIR